MWIKQNRRNGTEQNASKTTSACLFHGVEYTFAYSNLVSGMSLTNVGIFSVWYTVCVYVCVRVRGCVYAQSNLQIGSNQADCSEQVAIWREPVNTETPITVTSLRPFVYEQITTQQTLTQRSIT